MSRSSGQHNRGIYSRTASSDAPTAWDLRPSYAALVANLYSLIGAYSEGRRRRDVGQRVHALGRLRVSLKGLFRPKQQSQTKLPRHAAMTKGPSDGGPATKRCPLVGPLGPSALIVMLLTPRTRITNYLWTCQFKVRLRHGLHAVTGR
jgi:hypothetical protein